jgi:hypothetical protein
MDIIKKIVKKICIDLDVEFLFKLPKSVQQKFFLNAKQINTPISEFYQNFYRLVLLQNYDNFHTISLKLNANVNEEKMKKFKKLILEDELNKTKEDIDRFHEFDKTKELFYQKYTIYLDQFKSYIRRNFNNNRTITNAWLKCWEMIHFYGLIPLRHSDNFTVFCNAEFPGAFIFAIDHFIKTKTSNRKYEWFANSLWPGKDKDKGILGDNFGLYKKYNERWLMNGTDASGDVTSRKMVEIIKQKLNEKVDLYTSDIGIEVKIEDMIHQETVEAQLNLGQIVCALHTLKNGGHMVCKTFLFFKPMTMSLLYILTKIFRDLYICKPVTSRPGNSEIYIVGKYYKKDENVISTLETLLYDWDKTKIDFPIEPIPKEFYLQLVYDLYYIYGRQKQFIDKNVYLVKREYEMSKQLPGFIDIMRRDRTDESKKEIIIRQDIVNFWENAYPIPKFTDIL